MMAVLCYGRLQSYFYFLMLIVRILFPFEFFYVTFFLMFCLLTERVFVYDEKVCFYLPDNLLFFRMGCNDLSVLSSTTSKKFYCSFANI